MFIMQLELSIRYIMMKNSLQSELDSKVEQFTKKLAGEPVTPHISSGTVQFTPTPSKPSQQYGIFHKEREHQV